MPLAASDKPIADSETVTLSNGVQNYGGARCNLLAFVDNTEEANWRRKIKDEELYEEAESQQQQAKG